MSIRRFAFCLGLLAVLALVACTDLLTDDVIAQASRDGKIAFDVVKVDDAVVQALLARAEPEFQERFKKYVPPPDIKIAVGDIVAVMIWESAANGLFGNSITELTFPAGSAARLATGQVAAGATGFGLPGGVTASSDTLGLMLGLAPGSAGAATGQTLTGITAGASPGQPGVAISGGLPSDSLAGLTAGRGAQRLEQVLNLATQTGRPGTLVPDQLVGPDGAISVPYGGRVQVAGRTPAEVQHQIEALLAGKALDPQALVVVKLSPRNSVAVAGEAIGGKRIPLSPGGDRLLQVIAAAGGAKGPVHETFVRLSRGGVTATVPLATLVADPAQNIFVEPGDVLTVVRQPKTYTVFGAAAIGAAARDSRIEFMSEKLTLTEALARVGGLLDEKADPSGVFLFRYEPDSVVRALGQPIATDAPNGVSPIVYRLDLREAKSYLLAKQFPVKDKDIIFVANAKSVPVYRFFSALSNVTGPIETALITCHYNSGGC